MLKLSCLSSERYSRPRAQVSHLLFSTYPLGSRFLPLSSWCVWVVCIQLFLQRLNIVPHSGAGGRIWWLSRVARPLIGRKMTDWYRTVCALMYVWNINSILCTDSTSLESGALYCAGAITFLVISELTATTFVSRALFLPWSQSPHTDCNIQHLDHLRRHPWTVGCPSQALFILTLI
jgi:hypothetical protein